MGRQMRGSEPLRTLLDPGVWLVHRLERFVPKAPFHELAQLLHPALTGGLHHALRVDSAVTAGLVGNSVHQTP